MTMEMIGIAIGSAVTGAILMWFLSRQVDKDEDQIPVDGLGNCVFCKGWGFVHLPDSVYGNRKCSACLGTGSQPKPGYLADKPAEEKTP